MQIATWRVVGGRIYQSELSGTSIVVGTLAWYDWLEQHTAFTFVDRIFGFFLARKRSSASGELTWEASLVRARKLYRLLLGPSYTLTLSKLQSVAHTLAGPYVPTEWADTSPPEPVASQSQTPEPAVPRGSLMRTKLYLPRSGNDVIPRTRLIERLNAGLSGKVTLVCAPAGFGKTTLLVEWMQSIERPKVWLPLDEHDNELAVFVHSLTVALQSVFPDAFQATAGLFTAPQFPSSERVATLLSNDLADVPEDVVLVLDDYHLIRTIEVHTLLEMLIRHLPPQVHLVLATRSDPPLPLVKWRAQGHLNELRGADLRFTHEETETFLARVLGNDLAEQTIGPLEERTEGWIALLRLAVHSLRSTSHPAAFLEQLPGQPDCLINGYLLEEILAQHAPSVQELLLRTSILDTFCAEACAAIMGNAASAEQVRATLNWLERTNVFLIPLDEHQQWYRFHSLFKLLLQQRLQARISQEELAMLHRRACVWYTTQGLIEQAIKEALAGGDASYATRLVEAQFAGAFEQEHWAQMEHYLRLLPEDQIQDSPGLLIARMWILQAHGQLKDLPNLLTAAERLLETYGNAAGDPGGQQFRILHALIAIGWSMVQYFAGQAQASLESARSALQWIPPGEAHITNYALYWLALANQATGHEEMALTALNKALREPTAHLNNTTRLLFAQAVVYLNAGKLPQVEQIAQHLLRLAQDADLALSSSWAHWLLGVVYSEWNRLDAAAYHFTLVIANRHSAHFWAVRDAVCGLAFAYQVQGFGHQAQETADGLLNLVQEEHNLGELMMAYTFCGQLALMQDEVESAHHWLELAGKQEMAGPMMFLEDPPVTRAWMLLAKGDGPSVSRGLALLDRLLQHVEAIHNTRKTIKMLALQAWAYDLQGREAEALAVLERALALGHPGGFTRTFVDLPPLARLLQELRKRRKTQQVVDSYPDTYLQRILVAMNPLPLHAISTGELMRQEGVEPLTDRELQILRLLDKDLTNKEIARKLVVTPGTVKVHTNNVYRKLSVNNRRAAVSLSKALGLLAVK